MMHRRNQKTPKGSPSLDDSGSACKLDTKIGILVIKLTGLQSIYAFGPGLSTAQTTNSIRKILSLLYFLSNRKCVC